MKARRTSASLIALASVGLMVVYVALAALAPAGALRDETMSILYLAFPAGAMVCVAVAVRRASAQGRTTIRLLFIAVVLNLFGEAYWGFYQTFISAQGPPVSVADVGFLGFYLTMLVFVALVLRGRLAPLPVVARAKASLDTLAAMTIAGTSIVAILLATTLAPGSGARVSSETWAYSTYALLDVSLLVGVLAVAVTPRRFRWRSWEALMAAALVLFAGGDLVVNQLIRGGAYVLGDMTSALTDLTWMAGNALIGVGALMFRDDMGVSEELKA
ncbi:MAG: hypothetical protein FDZ75_01930, partial [Actinobacteria bacterium]